MKSVLAGFLALAVFSIPIRPSAAQTQPPTPPSQQQSTPPPHQPGGKVIFSRSTDENGQTTTQAVPQSAPPVVKMAAEPSAEDADRRAVTFTSFDLDVRLRTAEQHIAVRALVTVRNDAKTPLSRIPLQISSSLNWDRIRIHGADVPVTVATLNTDSDHTGQLHEAAVPLVQPLAPGQTLQLDVTYSGSIAPSAQRLLAVGTPEDLALHSDWDRIGVPFTGLRGFGNVVWYPVSAVPVILGDGARLFDEIGEQKLRLTGARFRLRLTVEFPHGFAPAVALINGHLAPLTVTDAGTEGQEGSGIATASSGDDAATLGFEAPSLFVAIRTPHPATNATIFALPEDDPAIPAWSSASAEVAPFVESWLGRHPHSQLTILDLPNPQDAPFETGSMLAAPIAQPNSDQLDSILVHALTHAFIHASPQSPPAWLDEGLASFMGTLWIEKQQGRTKALESLEASRSALALAEPESPGQSPGQPLAVAISPVYYRTKAAYVLWMLRDIAGDSALSAALRAYGLATDSPGANEPAKAKGTGLEGAGLNGTGLKGTGFSPYINARESVGALAPEGSAPGALPAIPPASARSRFEQLLEASEKPRDLSWFFADWVDFDKGLPDLSIESVFPAPATAGNWLVAVNVANTGYASAEIPVTVRSGSNSVTQRLLVPARGKAVQRILIQGKPTEVQVNDGSVPETQATVHITKLEEDVPSSTPPVTPNQ
ncbi:MAG: hypothetical protein ABR956_01230 [Terracidiphilus sp.]|jgi:hypothetical protein